MKTNPLILLTAVCICLLTALSVGLAQSRLQLGSRFEQPAARSQEPADSNDFIRIQPLSIQAPLMETPGSFGRFYGGKINAPYSNRDEQKLRDRENSKDEYHDTGRDRDNDKERSEGIPSRTGGMRIRTQQQQNDNSDEQNRSGQGNHESGDLGGWGR